MKQRPTEPNDCEDTAPAEESKGFASPPCLRHEIDPAYGGDLLEEDSLPRQGESKKAINQGRTRLRLLE